MKITKDILLNYLDSIIENPHCELDYEKDYELLIATVLSAQSTDKRVNLVTKDLFSKYDINTIKDLDINIIENIIKPVGSYHKKSVFIKKICCNLINDYDGKVPNNREYLESLPGVGRKTCNVVLSTLFDVPAIAVDTHVERVSKRLKIAKSNDNPYEIEIKLMRFLPKDKWSRTHHQLVLFGRYYCKSKKPLCENCPLIKYCQQKK